MWSMYSSPFFISVLCLLLIIYFAFSATTSPNSVLICTLDGFNIWLSTSEATYISTLLLATIYLVNERIIYLMLPFIHISRMACMDRDLTPITFKNLLCSSPIRLCISRASFFRLLRFYEATFRLFNASFMLP
jgi:hypothetical protein